MIRVRTAILAFGTFLVVLIFSSILEGYFEANWVHAALGMGSGIVCGILVEKLASFPSNDGQKRIHTLAVFSGVIIVAIMASLINDKEHYLTVALLGLVFGFVSTLDVFSISIDESVENERTS